MFLRILDVVRLGYSFLLAEAFVGNILPFLVFTLFAISAIMYYSYRISFTPYYEVVKWEYKLEISSPEIHCIARVYCRLASS